MLKKGCRNGWFAILAKHFNYYWIIPMNLLKLSLITAMLFSWFSHADDSTKTVLLEKVEELMLAQVSFEPQHLDRLLADEYIEISPKGEFDTKPMVLNYYHPSKKAKFIPVVEKSQVKINYVENMAHITLKETFKAPTSHAVLFSMRVTFVLKQFANQWKFTYAQYTPIVTNLKSQ